MDALKESIRAMQEEFSRSLQAMQEELAELRRDLDDCDCRSGSKTELDDTGSTLQHSEEDEEEHSDAGESESAAVESDIDYSSESGSIVRLDVGNQAWLKEVFFGGKPWLVFCEDKSSKNKHLTTPPPIFTEASVQLKNLATFGVVDCWERTSSGKTLAHRFDFPKPPVTFAVANGDPPVPIDMEGIVKPWQLRRKVQSHLQVSVPRMDSAASFQSLCTRRPACLVVGFKSAPVLASALAVLNPVLEEHRAVRAVAVDTAVWKVSLDSSLAATKPKDSKKKQKSGGQEYADLLCVGHQLGGKKRGGAFFRTSGDSPPTALELETFLDNCARGRLLVEIKKAPTLSLRPTTQPISATSTQPSSSSSTKKKSNKTSSSGEKKKEKLKKPIPSYGSSQKSTTKQRKSMAESAKFASAASGAAKGKVRDHVGSRKSLEEEEPLFSAVDPEDEDDEEVDEESGSDANEEEVEL
eukprot:gnl/TRDRNA2_/TRDRNA2_42048_c0_seq1.p1 gnl/TRDRNA2_/TRDRNA2_42048_c0~~gnl/TRDRNA2_/TRDRNA2_42048_c0_seq1.p1  ORF type:complete len:540 (-),score=121.12 gnl/TRDRNA2_/TRDRNA2_42048_c0_seq1:88-1491(-)